jgi:hypothetical protein
MNANELADKQAFETGELSMLVRNETAIMLRKQLEEIEKLKNANRFIQNFAEEQHQRAVALEMRELTDEEYKPLTEADAPYQKVVSKEIADEIGKALSLKTLTDEEILELSEQWLDMSWQTGVIDFARAVLRKAQEK